MIWYTHHDLWLAFYEIIPVQIGSSIFSSHCLVHALISMAINLTVQHLADKSALSNWMQHPSIYFNAFSSCLGFLMVYRARLAYARYWEARTWIAQLSSKLKQVAMQTITFVQANDVSGSTWKASQLRRIALYHALALLDLRQPGAVDLNHLKRQGLATDEEVSLLERSGQPDVLTMAWVVDAWVTRTNKSGGVDVAPPVYTRTFQLLSDVALARDHIHKIQDTPFPFAFAQVCSLLLVVWCLTLPVVVAIYCKFLAFGAGISFLAVLALFALNDVSSQLECPFRDTRECSSAYLLPDPCQIHILYYLDTYVDMLRNTRSE